MKVAEKYKIDKAHECKSVFWTNDAAGHPGVQNVMAQKKLIWPSGQGYQREASTPPSSRVSTNAPPKPARFSKKRAGDDCRFAVAESNAPQP